jgi:hypothetical protein
MDGAQGEPVGRRRRWLVIAVAVLVLMFVGTWAVWQRMDPRLIGEWQLSVDQGSLQHAREVDVFRPEFALEVRGDGLVDHVNLPGYGRGPGVMLQVAGPQRFKVSGDQFEISADGAEGILDVVVRLYNLIRGRRAQVYSGGRIVSVEGDKLVLWFEDWGELEFVRVTDGTLEERMQRRASGPVLASPGAARGSGK